MNHQRRASAGKNGMWIITQRDVGCADHTLGFALGVDLKVRRVTGVRPLRILQAMLFSIGIEMRAGRFEVWAFAFRCLVHMDGMLAWRQIVQIQLDGNAFCRRRKRGCANALSLSILQITTLSGAFPLLAHAIVMMSSSPMATRTGLGSAIFALS